MNKSVWISACGWVALFLVLVWLSVSFVMTLTNTPTRTTEGAIGGLAAVFSLPCFGLWLLGTVVHRFRVSGAKIKAEAMRSVFEQMQAAHKPGAQPARRPTSPLNLTGTE